MKYYCRLLNFNILQGEVTTCLWCGEIFSDPNSTRFVECASERFWKL